MKTLKCILISSVMLTIFAFQTSTRDVTYQRYVNNEPGNGTICLKKDGTFLTAISGGCDGKLESRGKWKMHKDTLSLTDLESRMMSDPWKKHGGESKYLVKKGTLTAFSIVDGKIVVYENEIYRKK